MTQHRVHRLLIGLLAAGWCLAIHAEPADTWTRDDAAHLLRRAGFGGTPQQIDRLQAMGKSAAVEYLLTGQVAPGTKPVFEPAQLAPFEFDAAETKATVAEAGVNLKDKPGQAPPPLDPAAPLTGKQARKAAKASAAAGGAKQQTAAQKKGTQRRLEIEALREWWLDRMVRTDKPLEEKMSLFWHGLFCSGVKETKDATAMARQNATFHAQALGNYKTLALAMVNDTAMCKYLNANENVKGKPNENLGRELMELFTMGEGQGYTEKDIAEVARALTGLAPGGGKNGKAAGKNATGPVALHANLHDAGIKTIFGQTGNYGPSDVVELIFAKPEPSRYLARRLWEFFAYPEPSDEDLQPVVAALKSSKYDLTPALRAIFASPAFYSEKARFALIKSPTEMAIETLRNLEITPTPAAMVRVAIELKEMDQELFQPPNVRGWQGGEHWITSATLFTRYNTATAMVNGQLAKNPDRVSAAPADPAKLFPKLAADAKAVEVVDAAVDRFLQRPLHPEKKQALLQTLGDAPIRFGDLESDSRVRQVLDLIVSTPEYQVH